MKKDKKNKSSQKNQNINVMDALKSAGLITPYQALSEKLVVERAMGELEELAEPMSEYLIAARANADIIRLYMERYIERIDCLLAMVDAVKRPKLDDEEDDEYDNEYEEDDEC